MNTMKSFIKNFLIAIPLALGIVFTIFGVVNALEISRGGEHAFWALSCGVTGVPLLYASIISIIARQKG
jgi:hypothetical protein